MLLPPKPQDWPMSCWLHVIKLVTCDEAEEGGGGVPKLWWTVLL